MKLRILVAGIRESAQRLLTVFSDCEVVFVWTMEEALTALSSDYDAILVAVRFDESRMFDLLRHLKADSELSTLPIICFRSAPGPVTATELARQAIELASGALGADAFVDLVGGDTEVTNQHLYETVFRVAGKTESLS